MAIADLDGELDRLEAAYDRFHPRPAEPEAPDEPEPVAEPRGGPDRGAARPAAQVTGIGEPAGEVRLQASWSGGLVVVWAAGPNAEPANIDGLADRLEAIGGPALGWSQHRDLALPGGAKAAALSIPVEEALGWLVAVGGGLGGGGVGSSVVWLGRAAVMAVRLV